MAGIVEGGVPGRIHLQDALCIGEPSCQSAELDGGRFKDPLQTLLSLVQPATIRSMFPGQQQYESLPWHLIQQAKGQREYTMCTGSNQTSVAVPSLRLSDMAPLFPQQPPQNLGSQGLINRTSLAPMDTAFVAPTDRPFASPSKQMFHSGERKRRRAMIEPPLPPWSSAAQPVVGAQEVLQSRLAIPSGCPKSPAGKASLSDMFRLPSQSAGSTPDQSQQTEEVNCGRGEGAPQKRVCLRRPTVPAPRPVPPTTGVSTQPLRLPGSQLLTEPVSCELCGQQRPSGLMPAHRKLECAATPAQCPQKGCAWSGPRQFLKLHLDDVCKWVLVPCPFTAPGWPPMIPRGLVRNWNFPQPAAAGRKQPAGKCPAGIASPCLETPEVNGRPRGSWFENSEVDEEDLELQSDADSAWSRTKAPVRSLLARNSARARE